MGVERFESLVNVAIGIAAAYMQFSYYWATRKKNSWRWIKLALAIVCTGWVIAEVVVLVFGTNIDVRAFHQALIKPLITITLATILSSGIMRKQTGT